MSFQGGNANRIMKEIIKFAKVLGKTLDMEIELKDGEIVHFVMRV
jgi:hypothetical protein